ncbi:conjugal transfer protein MobC [Paraflavisolibacter sp. H34]|uniref:conjugal transfer protein MobC n=1 Tax=Huijunlia imazamoxiresistens TaxID=3127457 RepID=UPI0030162F13
MARMEDEQCLRKIVDFTRVASILVLLLHFYYYCYGAFALWCLTAPLSDNILGNISRTSLFHSIHNSKLLSLGLLLISLLGAKGRKEEKIGRRSVAIYLLLGTLFYFTGTPLLQLKGAAQTIAILYITVTALGYILILTGGTLLSRLIRLQLGRDIFNRLNESFPQEERLLQNEYSINLPARYILKGKTRRCWINIINPFRGLLVLGNPGSGKTHFVIRHVISQHLAKGFSMFVYDFKFDDLTRITYTELQKCRSAFPVKPTFYLVNFEDLSRSHRCNPLQPSTLLDITDAAEAARTILMGLNRDWIRRQGDFFVESPINFLTAVIWFLKKYQGGTYCTLPHVIELMQADYAKLFPVLKTEKEIEVLVNPFISAYENSAMSQLEGQIGSAKIGLARLSSPQLYWVLSGDDFTLDINDPKSPKVVCMGNHPQKQQVYGAVISLYVNRLVRVVNRKNCHKCSLIFDEFPTIFFNDVDNLLATARSNRVATCLGIQDFSQLRKDYGKESADVVMNIIGNVISGQATGETAKLLSERFGRIIQVRESVSVNRIDTSISKSGQLDYAVPPSKIASLSSGEFVGMVADTPGEKIELKTFHAELENKLGMFPSARNDTKDLPVVHSISPEVIAKNFLNVKKDVAGIIDGEVERLLHSAGREGLKEPE